MKRLHKKSVTETAHMVCNTWHTFPTLQAVICSDSHTLQVVHTTWNILLTTGSLFISAMCLNKKWFRNTTRNVFVDTRLQWFRNTRINQRHTRHYKTKPILYSCPLLYHWATRNGTHVRLYNKLNASTIRQQIEAPSMQHIITHLRQISDSNNITMWPHLTRLPSVPLFHTFLQRYSDKEGLSSNCQTSVEWNPSLCLPDRNCSTPASPLQSSDTQLADCTTLHGQAGGLWGPAVGEAHGACHDWRSRWGLNRPTNHKPAEWRERVTQAHVRTYRDRLTDIYLLSLSV